MNHKLIAALHRVIAQGLTAQELSTRLRQLDENYGFYDKSQQAYMQKIYTESYRDGVAAVDDDVFTNSSKVTFQEARDRFEDYVKINEEDWDFIGRVAEGSQEAIDEILKRSGQPGFENDFDYDLYEKYYIDGSRKLEEEGFEPLDGIKGEKIFFVSDMAYSDGVGEKLWASASQIMKELADELMEQKV